MHWRNLMENRDRDKLNKNTGSTSSNIDKKKSDSSADFGQNVGKSENLNNEPGRSGKQGQSGMQSGSKPRQSGSDYESGSSSSGNSKVKSDNDLGSKGGNRQ
jgi:hypothetical protein